MHFPRISQWRLMLAALSLGLLVSVGPAAHATTANTSVPVPAWLIKWLKSRPETFVKGRATALTTQIMESLGFKCLATLVCWREGSYDPPRWFWNARVETGNGSQGFVRARGWPGTAADIPVIRTFPEGWKLTIFCQTTGPAVYGRWGWTNVWNYVGHRGDAPMFVSDGFVYTGTNQRVAGDCGATNMGGNP